MKNFLEVLNVIISFLYFLVSICNLIFCILGNGYLPFELFLLVFATERLYFGSNSNDRR